MCKRPVFSELVKLCSVVHTEAHDDNQNPIMNKALWWSFSVGNVCFLVFCCGFFFQTQLLKLDVLMQQYTLSFLSDMFDNMEGVPIGDDIN